MAKRRRGLAGRIQRATRLVVVAWALVTVLAVVAFRWVDPPTTMFIVTDRLQALWTGEPGYKYRHEWRDWQQISRNAKLAVVASEDQQFPIHHGFDFKQIDKALSDRERGRR